MGKFNYFYYKEKRFEKLTPAEQEDLVFDLINAFALMRNPVDAALLMQDLLTEKEVYNLAKRLRIAKLILEGWKQEDIVKELHCSYGTVAKVKIWLTNAGQGLTKVIRKLPERKKVYRPRRMPGVGYGLPQILLHYASAYMTKKEKERLEKFLGEMRSKAATDRDFREELAADFTEAKRRKKKRT